MAVFPFRNTLNRAARILHTLRGDKGKPTPKTTLNAVQHNISKRQTKGEPNLPPSKEVGRLVSASVGALT